MDIPVSVVYPVLIGPGGNGRKMDYWDLEEWEEGYGWDFGDYQAGYP